MRAPDVRRSLPRVPADRARVLGDASVETIHEKRHRHAVFRAASH